MRYTAASYQTRRGPLIGGRTFPVRAELAPAGERAELWRRLVEMYPYFTGYQQRTSREIPVVILTPRG